MVMMDIFKEAARRKDSWLCVGLDPTPTKTDASDCLKFNQRVIDSTLEHVNCYKLQLASYMALGIDGARTMLDTLDYIRQRAPETPVIGDAKFCDVKHTAAMYAHAAFEKFKFDCVTLVPYAGLDGITPFLEYSDKYVFVVTHMSNPSAGSIQRLSTKQGVMVYEVVADMLNELDQNRVGMVVGATQPEALARLRAKNPQTTFLVPGVGAQGGDLKEAVRCGMDSKGDGVLINASRSVIYAENPAQEAHKLNLAINSAISSHRQ